MGRSRLRRVALGPVGVLAVGIAAGCDASPPGIDTIRTLHVGDTARTYVLHAPPEGTARLPLLLVFHGTGDRGTTIQQQSGLDAVADERGMLVAYPDAAVGNWAEGCDCSRADLLGINDTGFVRAIIRDVASYHPVDSGRVYAVGFSQGGLFVHRLACEMADLFTAIGSVAAPMSASLAERCRPTAPVGVLILQGTLDDAFRYEGRGGGGGALLGARDAARLWRILNACDAEILGRELPDRSPDGTRVLEERSRGCRDGVGVVLYTVEGGRHTWSPSGDLRTDTLVSSFFLQQPRGGRGEH